MIALNALQRALLRQVDAGPYHSVHPDTLAPLARRRAADLERWGLLRTLPPTRRFPTRLVVTVAGSYALGFFDAADI